MDSAEAHECCFENSIVSNRCSQMHNWNIIHIFKKQIIFCKIVTQQNAKLQTTLLYFEPFYNVPVKMHRIWPSIPNSLQREYMQQSCSQFNSEEERVKPWTRRDVAPHTSLQQCSLCILYLLHSPFWVNKQGGPSNTGTKECLFYIRPIK